MATAALIGVGNSAAITIPKRFRTRNGLERGDRVLIEEATPTKIVIDVMPQTGPEKKEALARALEIADDLAQQSTEPFPSDNEALAFLLGDRDA